MPARATRQPPAHLPKPTNDAVARRASCAKCQAKISPKLTCWSHSLLSTNYRLTIHHHHHQSPRRRRRRQRLPPNTHLSPHTVSGGEKAKMSSFVPVNPRPFLQDLVNKDVIVRLKWNETEYKGRLVVCFLSQKCKRNNRYTDDMTTAKQNRASTPT